MSRLILTVIGAEMDNNAKPLVSIDLTSNLTWVNLQHWLINYITLLVSAYDGIKKNENDFHDPYVLNMFAMN